MSKSTTVVPKEVQAFEAALEADRKAKGEAKASTALRSEAARNVWSTAMTAFAKVDAFDEMAFLRGYHGNKMPEGQQLASRKNEAARVRHIARNDLAKAQALWPKRVNDDGSEIPNVPKVNKEWFLRAATMLKDFPDTAVETILKATKKVAEGEKLEGDYLAEIRALFADFEKAFPKTSLDFEDSKAALDKAWKIGRADGRYATSEEVAAAAKKEMAEAA